jgi:hypothetical protein
VYDVFKILEIFLKYIFIHRTSFGSQWLSKEDLEKKTVERLSDHEVKKKTLYFSI